MHLYIINKHPLPGDLVRLLRRRSRRMSEVLPPPELTEFLRGIKLQQYDVKLAALGFHIRKVSIPGA